jgi:hypothetical protein
VFIARGAWRWWLYGWLVFRPRRRWYIWRKLWKHSVCFGCPHCGFDGWLEYVHSNYQCEKSGTSNHEDFGTEHWHYGTMVCCRCGATSQHGESSL